MEDEDDFWNLYGLLEEDNERWRDTVKERKYTEGNEREAKERGEKDTSEVPENHRNDQVAKEIEEYMGKKIIEDIFSTVNYLLEKMEKEENTVINKVNDTIENEQNVVNYGEQSSDADEKELITSESNFTDISEDEENEEDKEDDEEFRDCYDVIQWNELEDSLPASRRIIDCFSDEYTDAQELIEDVTTVGGDANEGKKEEELVVMKATENVDEYRNYLENEENQTDNDKFVEEMEYLNDIYGPFEVKQNENEEKEKKKKEKEVPLREFCVSYGTEKEKITNFEFNRKEEEFNVQSTVDDNSSWVGTLYSVIDESTNWTYSEQNEHLSHTVAVRGMVNEKVSLDIEIINEISIGIYQKTERYEEIDTLSDKYSTQCPSTSLDFLPTEMICEVMSYLQSDEISKCRRVTGRLNQVVENNRHRLPQRYFREITVFWLEENERLTILCSLHPQTLSQLSDSDTEMREINFTQAEIFFEDLFFNAHVDVLQVDHVPDSFLSPLVKGAEDGLLSCGRLEWTCHDHCEEFEFNEYLYRQLLDITRPEAIKVGSHRRQRLSSLFFSSWVVQSAKELQLFSCEKLDYLDDNFLLKMTATTFEAKDSDITVGGVKQLLEDWHFGRRELKRLYIQMNDMLLHRYMPSRLMEIAGDFSKMDLLGKKKGTVFNKKGQTGEVRVDGCVFTFERIR